MRLAGLASNSFAKGFRRIASARSHLIDTQSVFHIHLETTRANDCGPSQFL